MRIVLVLAMVGNIMLAGCIGFAEGYGSIEPGYGLGNWEIPHYFEKDENNETEATLTELELRFFPESTINATFVEYWLNPGDGSEIKRVDPQETSVISHQYTGYGAFMAEYGVVDSEGNQDGMPYTIYDWPALIRSGVFYLNQSSVDELADLYIDPPHPESVGSAERIIIRSTVGNSWALPFTSEPTDITWNLIDPDGTVVAQHTESLDVGDEYEWEFYFEEPQRGAWMLTIDSSADVNLDQSTYFRMGYSGFVYDP